MEKKLKEQLVDKMWEEQKTYRLRRSRSSVS